LSLDNVELHLVDSVDDAFALMRWLSTRTGEGRDFVSFDTETTGLTRRDTLRTVQVGDADVGWTIPWHMWGGVFDEVVRKYEGNFVAHNAPFDVRFLKDAGVEMPTHRIHDTRPMAHILEPTYSTALKNLCARFVDPRASGMQAALDNAIGSRGGWSWASVPITFEPYWTYAALDPVLTTRLYEQFYPRIKADNVEKAYDIELAVLWVVDRMEEYGAHVDREYAREKMIQFEKYCDEVTQWCKKKYGISPGSNQAVIDTLKSEGFDSAAYWTKRTGSGATSLDKDVLAEIPHPLAESVLLRRQLQKLASTYLSHFVGEADENDLLHPSINTLGARTSRMSMSGPNLQNLPRSSESNAAAEVVRNCFTTRYDDGLMVFCDFDQIEMRGLAHLCNDQGMKDAFLSEGDFFVNLARQVFRDDTIIKSDPRRQITKNVGYGKIYGAGIRKLAITAGVSEEQAAAAMHAFDQSFPLVRQFQNLIQRTALERKTSEGVGYVRSPLTRRRHPSDDGKEYTLVNYLIQGMAAEIFKIKILQLDAAGLGEFMVVPVHDEMALDVPGSQVRDVAETLKKVMNDDQLLSVPITASVSVGKRWGAKTDFSQFTG
jgi:DNA polymerase I